MRRFSQRGFVVHKSQFRSQGIDCKNCLEIRTILEFKRRSQIQFPSSIQQELVFARRSWFRYTSRYNTELILVRGYMWLWKLVSSWIKMSSLCTVRIFIKGHAWSKSIFVGFYHRLFRPRKYVFVWVSNQKTNLITTGIFFSHFSLNSRQSKLKKFAKLKVFNLNSTVFLKFSHENFMIFS